MIAEQGQFEGSDWLSAVCGPGVVGGGGWDSVESLMPLDGQRQKIHSGVFPTAEPKMSKQEWHLVCQDLSDSADGNNRHKHFFFK